MRAGLASGAIAGAVVVAVAVGVVLLAGGLGGSTKTVTVVEEPTFATTAPTDTKTASIREIYARTAPGVVFVNASDVTEGQSAEEYLHGEGGEQGTATGSGFEIDGDGTILTNWHVVQGAAKLTVGLEDGRTLSARLVGEDPAIDLAVLRIGAAVVTLHPLSLGSSAGAHVGDPVLAIGNPFGLGGTLTTGVVSALGRQIQAPNGVAIKGALQTDAPINPGNSGGPLIDARGQVIGINSQIETTGSRGGNLGIAFAIPIDIAKRELSKLEKG